MNLDISIIKFLLIYSTISLYFCDLSSVDRCFCKLQEAVDDCNCSITNLESFNNEKIYPILSSLLLKDYFRYFKVNLNKDCPFWIDDSRCAIKDCHVKGCSAKEVPKGIQYELRNGNHEKSKYLGTPEIIHHPECIDENHGGLGNLDTFLSADQKQAMINWTKYDDQQDNFCEIGEDTQAGASFVDLVKNPERYTGYKGKSAHRIWNSIYKENCFNDHTNKFGIHLHAAESLFSFAEIIASFDRNHCLEKRIFYRMISGLHTSISIHLCRQYLLQDKTKMAFGEPQWGPNLSEFLRRFDPKHESDGPQRLKNLFFTYLVELRALAKVSDYLLSEEFYTGDSESDIDTRNAVKLLLNSAKEFPDPFDENRLFQGDTLESRKLKLEFKQHFRNISRIMDCVGCDKCKLWGKLQTNGMGTALKILFSYNANQPHHINSTNQTPPFQLSRNEIVSLFNAFGRLSTSIHSLSEFRKLLHDEL